MKIIDLLNKIANGEEVPKKIKYRNKIFIYDKDNLCYVVENYNEYYDLHISLSNHKGTDLNYEVEIIEEDKKIEYVGKIYDLTSLHNNYPEAAILLKDLCNKTREIIDEINKLKENK